ncbi:hypothetical protein [Nocardia veterana]|uniref:HipA-like protein n=1 Tax=Nocardia veterana TaxID=132249 RepID=A0A7X6M196_9NOCA|nr:hypothetical protein [Nocardia veterana]NKY87462.1 hypothetical protein [Nocardia veterana]
MFDKADIAAGEDLIRFKSELTVPENRLLGQQYRNMTPHGDRRGNTFLVDGDDGKKYIYKPESRDSTYSFKGFPSDPRSRTSRDIGTYRADRLFEFGRIPPTGRISGPLGPGSGQEFVPGLSPPQPLERYHPEQREQMAVLDYTVGAVDRDVNHGATPAGDLTGYDNRMTFPRPVKGLQLVSPFVKEFQYQPLSENTMRAVEQATPQRLAAVVGDLHGIRGAEIAAAQARLEEMRTRGMITGEMWPGEIYA